MTMIATVLPLMATGSLHAEDPIQGFPSSVGFENSQLVSPAAVAVSTDEPVEHNAPTRPKSNGVSPWFVRVGVARAHYNSGARIALDGARLPGATVGVTDSTTVTFDVGYDLSENVSVMLMGGIPPRAAVIGQGSVSSFGKLGHVRFGPAVLTAVYRLPGWHGLRPYAGAGGTHLFILKTEDAAVTHLKAHDSNGFVVQAGVECRLNERWELFADYKHIWLKVNAEGFLAGEPVRARVTLDPDLVSAGVKFRFR
jgi:outer membrane protein